MKHMMSLMRETDPIVDIDVYNTGEETMLTGILKIIIQENDSKDINIKTVIYCYIFWEKALKSINLTHKDNYL